MRQEEWNVYSIFSFSRLALAWNMFICFTKSKVPMYILMHTSVPFDNSVSSVFTLKIRQQKVHFKYLEDTYIYKNSLEWFNALHCHSFP